jgi:peptidase E
LSVVGRHIVALGGGGLGMAPGDRLLDDFVLRLTGRDRPRICFLPTAGGDAISYPAAFYDAFADRTVASWLPLFNRRPADPPEKLLDQDVIWVGGGNTANLLAIWRLHGVDRLLREAWRRGVVLAGVSAGAICWFSHGVTDSFGPKLAALDGGLGLIAGSFCPHYDTEPLRRPRYAELLRDGLPGGWAADDGAAVHFVDGELSEVVASRPGAGGYRVELRDGEVVETPLATRQLGEGG